VEDRLARARELNERLPEGAPRRSSDEERLAQEVATALETWRSRPELREPAGLTMAELEAQIAEIDRQLAATASTAREMGPGHHRSRVWPLLGAGGVIAGGALGLAGLVLPGAIIAVLAAALIGWWAFSRPRTSAPVDAGAAEAMLETERRHVEHLIEDRRGEERASAEAARLRNEAVEAVRRAALAARLGSEGPDAQVEALLGWQVQRTQTLAEADQQRADWEELQRLLGERSLDEFAAAAARLRAEAETLRSRVDGVALATAAHEQAPSDAQLRALQQRVDAARDEWNTARGELTQFAQDQASVAEAEETLAAAERELERVERLDRTLGTTIEFLGRAEERVHRDIAPVLRETVLEWLSRVTGGRYTDCRVDPQTLAVDVCGPGGRWRQAKLLSHGTAEQLYLLLRLALTRHLTKPGEVCPLIFDDAVAACDGDRKREVLETLLAISESVQVILFTHEEDVRTWAGERLSEPRDRLAELDPAGVPA
jgi:hypothetical protein